MMSEQPLLDIEALKKIDAKPGDVFVLQIPDDFPEPTPQDQARVAAHLRGILGDVKVVVLSSGLRLGSFRVENATERPLSVSVRSDANIPVVVRVEEPSAADPSAAKPSLTWGNVEKLTQDALKWHKEYAATAAASALKQADLRILLDGEPVPIGSPAYCTPWMAEEIDCTTHIVGTQRRRGQFIARSGCDLLGRRIRVEHLDDGEAFDAIVTLMTDPGRYLFVSDGPPSPLPVPSLKEANEQHAAEPIEPQADEPQADEPQADEPHKVQWREFL